MDLGRRGGGKGERVLDRLGQAIVAGRYAAGAKLPTEDELARKLGVSRPSLREGLKALARKGLVEARTRRGTIALARERWDVLDTDVLRWAASSPPDHAFLLGLIELRSIMEPAAARLAASRATPAQILQIERAFQGMVDSLPHDLEACHHHDLAFHGSIFTACGNVMLHRFYDAISSLLLTLFRASTQARESYQSSLAEHGAVAVAIRRRRPEEAEKAMHKLLAGTVRDLEPAFTPKRRPRGGKS
ncbi:MAG TPA: FadR/GntR family transcriptional regulator [Burkholderiales bacterium]|nr:FadR/GntR family transcriptional regulator [Burkholderiales bacterium]